MVKKCFKCLYQCSLMSKLNNSGEGFVPLPHGRVQHCHQRAQRDGPVGQDRHERREDGARHEIC